MKVNQLKYFIEVAKEQSITKAAEKCFVGQPTISKAIAKLEEEFDIILFERCAEGVKLTQQGKIFLEYAKTIKTNMETLEKRFSKEVAQDTLSMRVGIDKQLFLGKAIAQIGALHTEIPFKINITEELKENMIGPILKGEILCAIIIVAEHEKKEWEEVLQKEGIMARHLATGTYEQLTKQNTFQYNQLKEVLRYCTDKHTVSEMLEASKHSHNEHDGLAYEVQIIYAKDIKLSEEANKFIQLTKVYFQVK